MRTFLNTLQFLLVMLGMSAALGGVVMTSEATTGVGLVTFGCFLGILARLAQAGHHQQQLVEELKAIRPRAVSLGAVTLEPSEE